MNRPEPSLRARAASGERVPTSSDRVPVWDAVVRLVHWSLAALVLANLVLDDGFRLHRVLGYVAAGLVAARLLWAAWAGGFAGFGQLKLSPAATWRYLAQWRRGEAPHPLGHNPLGRWMVWLLWSLVLLLGLTGWLGRLDAFWGEDWPRELHALLADTLWVAVSLHLAGVAVMSLLQRENLVAGMLTGRKRGRAR